MRLEGPVPKSSLAQKQALHLASTISPGGSQLSTSSAPSSYIPSWSRETPPYHLGLGAVVQISQVKPREQEQTQADLEAPLPPPNAPLKRHQHCLAGKQSSTAAMPGWS